MSISPQSQNSIPVEEIFDAAPDAIIAHDLNYRVLFWNRAAEELYGWKAEEILGHSVAAILYLDENARKEALDQLKEVGFWDGTLHQINRQNSEYLVHVCQKMHCDGKGKPVAVICFNREIANKRKVEGSAAAYSHHIQSSRLLGDGVAHELNNALAPIMLSSAMLKRSVKNDKAKGMVAMIEKCATKGARLVNELLCFERGKGGGEDRIRKTQILRSLQRAKDAIIPEKVRLDVAIADDLWEFPGDLNEIEDVFCKLIQNACESMPEGGLLQVEVANCRWGQNESKMAPDAEFGDYVSIAFKDTGAGIRQEIIDRVAEPLFTTKLPKQGFGFGLSRAHAIVKGHKGFMVLESCSGEGTTVIVYLPASATGPLPVGSERNALDSLEGSGRLILVADDERFVRETIQQALEDRGYSVMTVQNGKDALARYKEHQTEIDLVISNLDMPFMDGPTLAREILQLNPKAKILFSSGHSRVSNFEEIPEAGADHFLPKPFTSEQLTSRVCKLLKG
jgi:PAS domain S-box-containing protein